MTDESKLASEAPPPQTAEPSPLLVDDWFSQIEMALYGKTGNTFTERQMTALRAVISHMLPEPSGPSRLPHTEERCCEGTMAGSHDPNCVNFHKSRHDHYNDGFLAGWKAAQQPDAAGGPSRLRALISAWRVMQLVAGQYSVECPIDDAAGAEDVANAFKRCADELEALVGPVSVETKKDDDDLSRLPGQG